MAQAGQNVFVHYKGSLEDGTVFDSSEGRDPLEFVAGSGQVIPGFENAVLALEIGESVTVTIPAAEAYGEYSEEGLQIVPIDQIPNADQLPVGKKIYFTGPGGEPFAAKVLKIEDDMVHFDFNHELAGKDLTFDLTLVDAKDAGCESGSCESGDCSSDCSCGCGC